MWFDSQPWDKSHKLSTDWASQVPVFLDYLKRCNFLVLFTQVFSLCTNKHPSSILRHNSYVTFPLFYLIYLDNYYLSVLEAVSVTFLFPDLWCPTWQIYHNFSLTLTSTFSETVISFSLTCIFFDWEIIILVRSNFELSQLGKS